MKTVILADGTFPQHSQALNILAEADFVIACDGAAGKMLDRGIVPQLIIGDLDSVSQKTLKEYEGIIIRVKRQDNTDLMKALEWCIAEGIQDVSILGANGGREDHTIGNLFAITRYATQLCVALYTDTGWFVALTESGFLQTEQGQQISLFPQPQSMKITTRGLKYPLCEEVLPYIYSGTLNEALAEQAYLSFDKGVLLVYRTYLKS